LSPVEASSEGLSQFSNAGQMVGEVIGKAFKALFAPIIFVTKGISFLGDVWNRFFSDDERKLALTTVNKTLTDVDKAASQTKSTVETRMLASSVVNKTFSDVGKQQTTGTAQIARLTASVSSAPSQEQANALAAAQNKNTHVQQTNHNQIVINTAPSMDAQQIAEEVMREMEDRQSVNNRAALNDGAL
jgi:hypothetical protein